MLVGALVSLLFVALVQLAIALHVRNVLIDSAAEGARYGAFHGNGPEHAVARARDLIASSLNPRFAEDIVAIPGDINGTPTLEVTVRAPLPLVWLYGPANVLEVTGRAVEENS